MESTIVTFPQGATTGTATVVLMTQLPDGRAAVVTDSTPFHPLDHTWPDQPADRGTLAGLPVADCLTGAVAPDGTVHLGADIPVRRGEPGWAFVVVHVLPSGGASAVGERVELVVDEQYRSELSRGHTATHVMALAMNAAAAPLWTKDVDRTDALGHPDLDSIAMAESRILPLGARDTYRLGKSVRKKGLSGDTLREALPAIQEQVNTQLAEWIGAGGAVHVETGGDARLEARRLWTAQLPGGAAVSIPCGGTHVSDLRDLGRVTITYEPTEEGFVAHTVVTDAPREAAG